MAAPDDLDFNLESGYTAPGFNAVAFDFPYLAPPADDLNFDLTSGYIPPLYTAVDFGTEPGEPTAPGAHEGTAAATTDNATGQAQGTASAPAVEATASATTEAAEGIATASHGINADASATADDAGGAVVAKQGVEGSANTSTESAAATASAEFYPQVIGTAEASTESATGAAAGQHIEPRIGTVNASTDASAGTAEAIMEVYALSGAVQDENGLPMERTVRAHRLNDGSLIAETVSASTGIFDLNVGFEPAEFYVIALDTGPEGTDYLPPITNRITSVLRYD